MSVVADIKQLMAMAQSGQVQAMLEQFSKSMAEINAERAQLKTALPQWLKHYDVRFDAMTVRLDDLSAKLDIVIRLVTPPATPQINGAIHNVRHGTDLPDTTGSDANPSGVTLTGF